METTNDRNFMLQAIELANLGKGKVNPNPLVGAVLVRDGKIIGKGYHEYFGGPHAEVNAIAQSSGPVEGATIYVTLEPCSHFGKTPPCTDLLIKNKISKIFIAATDPNPLVNGKGIAQLQAAGIEVVTGLCETEALEQNRVFFKYMTQKRPYVLMKTAMSLDGKISTHLNLPSPITGPESQNYVHRLRNEFSAIMVGVNTVLIDNPELTCRLPEGGRNPRRIVVDSQGRIPLNAKLLQTPGENPVILATTEQCPEEIQRQLTEMGHLVWVLPQTNKQVDLNALVVELGKLPIDSVLLEGGGTLNEAALQAGIVDEVQILIAPLLIGGKDALTPVEGKGFAPIENAVKLCQVAYQTLGQDFLIKGKVIK